MLMKKGYITLVFLFVFYCGFSTVQYYESVLNSGTVTKVTPLSYISWGLVDFNYVQLNKIFASDDGMIKFNIQPTNYVEVSLTNASNLNLRFGFIFKSNNHFTIQINGVEEDLGALGYTALDEFRVVKCGVVIRYYKNEDLLYEHCLTNPADELVHTTHVTTATNTELILEFNSDLSNCSDPFMFAPVNENASAMVQGGSGSEVETSENRQRRTSNQSEMVFSENRIIVASVYNETGIPVKQFRIRTTTKGTIPEEHEIYEFMGQSYRIEFKEQE